MKADRARVLRLLKTARGQIDGIMKMVEEDQYCVDISHQLLASQALLRKVNAEILEGHIRCCVRDAFRAGAEDESDAKVRELIDLLGKMAK